MSIGQHIVIRLRDNRPIFTELRVRRAFSLALAKRGEAFDVVGWGAADNHGHTITLEDSEAANELARRVECSLTHQLGLETGFATASLEPIRDWPHLYNSIGYAVKQGERHAPVDDPFHEGSSLPDSMGLRVIAPYLPPLLARVAPRLDLSGLVRSVGALPSTADAERWGRAVCAVIGVGELAGASALVRMARRTVLELAPHAPTSELRRVLGCSARTIARLRKEPPPPQGFVDAVVGQARWRAGVETRSVA